MIDILFWLIISSIAALVGAALGRLVTLRAYSPLTRLLLFVTLGYLVLAYLLLGLGLLGLLQPVPVLVVLVILLLVGLTAFRTLWRDLCAVSSRLRHALLASSARWLYWFVLLCALASLILALAPPAGLDWDGLAEHLAMAKEWVKAGRIIPLWYDHHSQFPPTLQMLYALALLFRGASAAKLFHFGFGLIALGAVFVLTRRHLSRPAAPWAAAVLAATPVFSWLMGAAYVDLPVVACVLLAVHFFLEWVSSGAVRDAALSGLLAGAAMAFKMQGIPYFGLLLIFAVYIAWRGRRQETPRWRAVAIFAAVGLLVASPWHIKSWVITGNPVYPFAYSTFGGNQWSAQQAEWYRHHQLQFGVGELPSRHELAPMPWYQRTFTGPRQPLHLLLAPFNLTFNPPPFTDPVSPAAAIMFFSIGPLYLIFTPMLLAF
ncbi:MAG: glycosyltransferase family 39 protein, partial [Planctomycetes bacterium]|nr:glycosyltransferase family 39 protein [Planctomycetota bacterium]